MLELERHIDGADEGSDLQSAWLTVDLKPSNVPRGNEEHPTANKHKTDRHPPTTPVGGRDGLSRNARETRL